jgi:hypothetical protein
MPIKTKPSTAFKQKKYFYSMMSDKTHFNDFNVQFIKLSQTKKLHPYLITSTSLVLLSIPASLLFHEILILLGGLFVDTLLTFYIFKLNVENWTFFVYKPLLLWKAKMLLLLHTIAGNYTK